MQFETRLSPHFNDRSEGSIDMLILHYTGLLSAEESIDTMLKNGVSAHYLIDEDGSIFKIVDEEKRAWHAGVSYWQGERDVNSRSIGIEIQNPGHEHGYRAFPQKQMEAVLTLCQDILSRHDIPPGRVLAHSDVAPDRKMDPGELFDWPYLAQNGVGLWPDTTGVKDQKKNLDQLLLDLGYDPDVTAEQRCSAFCRHFAPENLSAPDQPAVRKRAAALMAAKP